MPSNLFRACECCCSCNRAFAGNGFNKKQLFQNGGRPGGAAAAYGCVWGRTCVRGARVDVVLRQAEPVATVTTIRGGQRGTNLLLSRFTACTTSSSCATDSVRSARALSASRLVAASSGEAAAEESRARRARRGRRDASWRQRMKSERRLAADARGRCGGW
jgi:hypothetical protein